jgi:hypothetical protein
MTFLPSFQEAWSRHLFSDIYSRYHDSTLGTLFHLYVDSLKYPPLKGAWRPAFREAFPGGRAARFGLTSYGVNLAALPRPPPLRTLFDLRSRTWLCPLHTLLFFNILPVVICVAQRSSQPLDPLRTIGEMRYCICLSLDSSPLRSRGIVGPCRASWNRLRHVHEITEVIAYP